MVRDTEIMKDPRFIAEMFDHRTLIAVSRSCSRYGGDFRFYAHRFIRLMP
jgi:hypothetical protein